MVVFIIVHHNVDVDLLGLSAFAHGVEHTVLREAECAVVGNAQVAHRVVLELGDLLSLFARGGSFEDVHVAVLLAQIIVGLAVGSPNRVAELAVVGSNLFEGAVLRVGLREVEVAGDGRAMVLAPFVFVAFYVLIKQFSLLVDGNLFHSHHREKLRAMSLGVDAVDLREGSRKIDVGSGRSVARRIEHVLVVEKSFNCLVGRMSGQAFGRTSVLGDGKDVKSSAAIRRESNGLSVGRPMGIAVVSRVGREAGGLTAL